MSHLHIPDGVLPVWLWALGWLVTLAAVGLSGRLSEREGSRRKVPLLAVVSALMIVAMSSEIVPIAYHVNLTVIGGVLLGPALSVLAAFIVEVVLALLGHGGVTVLGLNTVLIGSEMIIGWALFRLLTRALGRRRIRPAAFLTTVATLALTTVALLGIVSIGGSSATARETGALDPAELRFENPFAGGVFELGLFSGGEHDEEEGHAEEDGHVEEHGHAEGLSVGRFAAVVFTLGPIGWVLEGLLTAWLLGYAARVRPGLIWSGVQVPTALRPPGDEGTVG